MSETAMIEASRRSNEAPEDDSLEEQSRRLKALVAELLKTNQQLRFDLATLSDETDKLRRGLANAPPWAGMLF
jgi:hypothetical protein